MDETRELQEINQGLMKKFLIGWLGAGVVAIVYWWSIGESSPPGWMKSPEKLQIGISFFAMAILFIYGLINLNKMLKNVGKMDNDLKRPIDQTMIFITVLIYVQLVIAGFFSIAAFTIVMQ